MREAADLGEGARPVRQPCVVAEVDEVLVGQADEAFVKHGQATDAGIEHTDRARVGRGTTRWRGFSRELHAALRSAA